MYVVKPRDNLARIAKAVTGNEANWHLIIDANPGLDERNLKTGQEIRVPVKKKKLPASIPSP
jgi:nucleoid-associated protein YgaU